MKKEDINFYNNIVGKIFYLKYLLIKDDEIRLTSFIGLCVYHQKRNGSFAIKNIVKNESLTIIANLQSPTLQTLLRINRYKKKFKLNKLK